MFCSSCGQEVESGRQFCSSCGQKYDISAAELELGTSQESKGGPARQRKTKKFWTLTVSVISVLCLAIVAVLVLGNREISKVDALKTQVGLSSFVDGTSGGATGFQLRTHDECPADDSVANQIDSTDSWYKNSISGQSYSFFQEVFATASEESSKELASKFSEFTSFCDTQTQSEEGYIYSRTNFGDFGTIRDVFGLDIEGVVLDFKHCDNMSECWGDGNYADARVVVAYRGKVVMLMHYSINSSGYPVKLSPMSFDQVDLIALSALEDFAG